MLGICYTGNYIGLVKMDNILENVTSQAFELRTNLVCDGFHSGSISAMDVAIQRPIIVTYSNEDKSIRVWNYLTGHCEYCKIIFKLNLMLLLGIKILKLNHEVLNKTFLL